MKPLPEDLFVEDLPDEPMTALDRAFLMFIITCSVAPWALLAWALLTGRFGQ